MSNKGLQKKKPAGLYLFIVPLWSVTAKGIRGSADKMHKFYLLGQSKLRRATVSVPWRLESENRSCINLLVILGSTVAAYIFM